MLFTDDRVECHTPGGESAGASVAAHPPFDGCVATILGTAREPGAAQPVSPGLAENMGAAALPASASWAPCDFKVLIAEFSGHCACDEMIIRIPPNEGIGSGIFVRKDFRRVCQRSIGGMGPGTTRIVRPDWRVRWRGCDNPLWTLTGHHGFQVTTAPCRPY